MLNKSIKIVLTVNTTLDIKGNKAKLIVENIKVKPSTLSLPINEQLTSKNASDITKKMKKSSIQKKNDHEMINKAKRINAELTRPKKIQWDEAIKQSQIEREKHHKMILDAHDLISKADIKKKKRTQT